MSLKPGRIRIPFVNQSKGGTALRACVEFAAERSGHNPYLVATVMSYFLEEVANQVSRGNVVSVPGFAAFGPLVNVKSGRIYPGMSAQNSFRQQVDAECPRDAERLDWLRRHGRSHSVSRRYLRPGIGARRSFTTMELFRQTMVKQAYASGLEVQGDGYLPPIVRRRKQGGEP